MVVHSRRGNSKSFQQVGATGGSVASLGLDEEEENHIARLSPPDPAEADEYDNSLDAGQSANKQDPDDNTIRLSVQPKNEQLSIGARKLSTQVKKSSNSTTNATRSSTATRLTMLEQSSEASRISNRETILSQAAQTNPLDRLGNNNLYDIKIDSKTTDAINRQHQAAGVTSSQYLLLGSSYILLLLGLLIIYKWFHKSASSAKKREARSGLGAGSSADSGAGDKSALCDEYWSPHSIAAGDQCDLSPSRDQDLRKRASPNHYTNEQDTIITYLGSERGYGSAKLHTSYAPIGEQIPLVSRISQCKPSNQEDADAIQSIGIEEDEHRAKLEQNEKMRRKRPISTMVTLKRRLNRSSLLLAARSTARPKVRLISNRVRKFIDDEAEEMKAQTARRAVRGKNPTLASKVFTYLLTSVGSSSGRNAANEEHTCDEGQSMPLVVRVESEKNKEGEDVMIQQKLKESCDIETLPARKTPDAAGQLLPASAALINSDNQKLSPSPNQQLVLNGDACSSNLSGCSLFSPSPMHENIGSPPCNCTAHLSTGGTGLLQHCDENHGHSPYPLSAGVGGGGPSPIAIYRPCCSASPSTLITGGKQVISPADQQATACYQQHHHHPEAMRVNSAGHWPHYMSRHHDEMFLAAGKSSSSRIKRQYENYYDDEHEDTYRRLTASFGMDLGFGLHHPNTCGSHHLDPAATTTIAANVFTPPHHNNQHLQQPAFACKCCSNNQQLAQPVGQQHSVSGPNLHPQLGNSPYMFKSQGNASAEGSAGELISTSASTSLGGSDSGFVVSTQNNYLNSAPSQGQVCRDPLCACRSVSSSSPTAYIPPPMPAPPMSILVQQPSFATPPPPHQQSPTQSNQGQLQQQENVPPPTEIEIELETRQGERKLSQDSAVAALSPLIKSCNSHNKWKHRRRLSQRVRTDLHFSQRHCKLEQQPRRMSIAGDQVTHQRNRPTTGASLAQSNPSALLNQHVQHRASIASTSIDGHWQQQHQQKSPTSNQTPSLRAAPLQHLPGHSYPLHHNQTEPALFSAGQSMVSRTHRPSDASLYEVQSCSSTGPALMNGKSSYSSSTSSGIGISGSTCTNTPTTSAFPYGSFATGESQAEPFAIYPAPCETTTNAALHQSPVNLHGDSLPPAQHGRYQWLPPQCNPMLYNMSHGLAGGAQAALDSFAQLRARQESPGPSRKYSLPVHLESQVAERLSPSKTRLLFEKNLQRVDSAKTGQSQQQPYTSEIHSAQYTGAPWRPGLEGAITRGARPTLADSRRSSQTITRQSSFWLDEDNDANCTNTVDSMMSISMAMPSAGHGNQSADQCKPESSSSQRPSLGSLVLSGDSIESVKQRPAMAQPIEPAPQVGDASEAQEEETPPLPTSSHSDSRESRPAFGAGSSIQRHVRNRFSSSTSTSSAASSPSPDFSRPSERILALASKSSSISKRHLMSKLSRKTPKRLPRLGSATSSSSSSSGGSTNTDPVTSIKKLSPFLRASNRSLITRREPSEDADIECAADECLAELEQIDTVTKTVAASNRSVEHEADASVADGDLPGPPVARPIADLSSASLERQCRDLWKLRATLHSDSCTSDNWSNYHQRLNRRYDSGYKSVENQLSSSLENNIAAALPSSAPRSQASSTTVQSKDDQMKQCMNEQTTKESEDKTDEDKGVSSMDIPTPSDHTPVNEPALKESPGIDGKLAELELDDLDVECLIGVFTPERECQSRTSSKGSSGEEEKV